MNDADVIIIGSGMGGATLAVQLAPSGRRILIVEKGERLQPSPADRDAEAIFARAHFRPNEEWLDGNDQPFNPGNYYNVGGNSKFYGAVLLRYRREDFSPLRHMGGTTTGWPIGYDILEPWYQRAEDLFEVRGVVGEDPTEPPHSGSYGHRPVPDEPMIADLRRRLKSVGLHPASLPLAVDIDTWLANGKTTWDAFPDTCGGKKDAETVSLKHALRHSNVSLVTGCEVTRLMAGEGGKITGVEVLTQGERKILTTPLVVLAAGAVRSAAILLSSANENHPKGLANRSDQVGRNFMNHNCSAVLALHPLRRNPSIYQKTLLVNDFYLAGGPNGEPLGNIQLLGKITGPILAASSPLPRPLAQWIANRSVDFYAMSEDLPNPESRITVRNGRIMLDWKRSNWEAHLALVDRLKSLVRKAGYPVVLSRPFDRRTPSHQCGTVRMGSDPMTSVVDSFGRSHDHRNLFVVDASILPTSAAVNPALTIAALALRSGQHIIETEFKQ
ncbi:GMC family oxidoreductase (plasmid) [Peteryoungia desertarenae]|uniref:GMC family oxidoreductase n=1 Tax=Peteryoungia desertarenae TaxID=1813451 RepID=A0ABX6QTI3_9HYPH|nr:GMC family oxidoreductase [Peteryoungia desertarenae]QLF71840.1 GMC family oxidoreductase [Peteryoungia desertarenae]